MGVGAPDGAGPTFMGLARLGLDIGIFDDFLYSVLLLAVVLGLDVLGLAISQPQVGARGHARAGSRTFYDTKILLSNLLPQ